ncbi:MAG: tetratricopeptide repeat protein [Gemmataceae bacterium]
MTSAGGGQPSSLDYGSGGNVTYEGNTVYLVGRRVGSKADLADSAADLATVPPPTSNAAILRTAWLPLGTFAISTSEKETDPSRLLQLAISTTGIISGMQYDTKTDRAEPVQGQLDKATQRVAFRIGDNEETVYEAGLFNLTQDEVSVLVHSGPDKVDVNLLVRLQKPQEQRTTREDLDRLPGVENPEMKARSRFDLAMLLAKSGKSEKAREWCTEIVAKYPDTRAGRDASSYLKKSAE